MRKLFSLGLLAILLSVPASPVFAGNVEECEVLKRGATKGLYKLCLAYHNTANSDAKERFLNKYNDKAGPDDPPMPGTEAGVPCPCWTMDQMVNAISVAPAHSCQVGSDQEFAIYTDEPEAEVTFLVDSFGPFGCFYIGPYTALFLPSPLDEEDEQACRDEIQALVDEDFTAITCT